LVYQRVPGGGGIIGKIRRRNRLVVHSPLQLIEWGADIDVRTVKSCNQQVIRSIDERLPRMKDARHFARAHPVKDIF
jgi:hypothetical protein